MKERNINLSNLLITCSGQFLYVWYMTDGAKIILSAQELQLMHNKDWILTKRIVIDKVNSLFGSLVPGLKEIIAAQQYIPAEAAGANPKIHKGENYLGLPYLLLDYPAFFSKEGVFALRTFFWWGNFFSVTLHLSGSFKKMLKANLCQNAAKLQQAGYSLCINEDEWQHHFETDNYVPAAQVDIPMLQSIIEDKAFVKLGAKFELSCWEEMPGIVTATAEKMLRMVTD
jgi:hypothetical protein